MTVALCLGGADTVWNDVDACPVPFDCVIACNDAGVHWPGELDAWVTLHANKFRGWKASRKALGYPKPRALYSHRKVVQTPEIIQTPFEMPGTRSTGSSGLFMAKVALQDMRVDRVILCGVPMLERPHFFGGPNWKSCHTYRKPFLQIDQEIIKRMRSMSGWTRLLLGPAEDFL